MEATAQQGFTPLIVASQQGHLDVVLLALGMGANVEAVTEQGWRALHVASEQGHAEVARTLLDHEATIEATTLQKETALHWAAEEGRMDVVRLLLDRGANVHAKDAQDRLPSARGTDEKIRKLLAKEDGSYTRRSSPLRRSLSPLRRAASPLRRAASPAARGKQSSPPPGEARKGEDAKDSTPTGARLWPLPLAWTRWRPGRVIVPLMRRSGTTSQSTDVSDDEVVSVVAPGVTANAQ